jgi:tellurite resistance protein
VNSTSTIAFQESYLPEQVVAWLRGLVTVAWSDGSFSEDERTLISSIVASDLAPKLPEKDYEPISPKELAESFGANPSMAENFLRTAVMVALADGLYSSAEDQLLTSFCDALRLQTTALDALRHTLDGNESAELAIAAPFADSKTEPTNLLAPVQHWLDGLEMHDPRIARFLCKMIPPQCPFERDIKLFNRKVVHIPPMCKLNPLYEQLVGLRFRALSYLADDCKEDVTPYC